MQTEYVVHTPRSTATPARSLRVPGVAFVASAVIGVAISILTLFYPAAVASDRWSYPFGATAQWIVGIVLAVTHVLSIAGFVGIIAAGPHRRSRLASVGLWVAIVGFAGLTVCEILSGAVGTRSNDSSFASAVGAGFGIASLLTAAGSIAAGIVIVRSVREDRFGWSMLLWSGIAIVVLVTPAQISGKLGLEMAALIVWSLTFMPLGLALTAGRGTASFGGDLG